MDAWKAGEPGRPLIRMRGALHGLFRRQSNARSSSVDPIGSSQKYLVGVHALRPGFVVGDDLPWIAWITAWHRERRGSARAQNFLG